jgi:hypothetical protein
MKNYPLSTPQMSEDYPINYPINHPINYPIKHIKIAEYHHFPLFLPIPVSWRTQGHDPGKIQQR